MGTHTKAMRRGDIMALAAVYNIPIKLSPGEIDLAADIGKYDAFAAIFPEHHHLFRVSNVTFSHGDTWPTYFFGLAGRQYIPDGNGGFLPIRFAKTQEVPMLTRNGRISGTATQPVLYTADRKFYFIPNSIAGATIEHFVFPSPLADAGTADSTVDSMPDFSEPLIARSGFEAMLKMLLDQQTALELTREDIAHTEATLRQLYEEKFGMLNRQPTEKD